MTDDIQSVSDLKRALGEGRCFVAELPRSKMYFELVEDFGYARTETNLDESNPETMGASQPELRAALRYGVEELEDHEIPYTEDD